jgi:predicted O-methyltransferase YrrM
MILRGAATDTVIDYVRMRSKGAEAAVLAASRCITRGNVRQQIRPYQAHVLYHMARRYNREGARILEIGTYYGYSAAVMAQAAPLAHITTLTPMDWEANDARVNLAQFGNATVLCKASWDYLTEDTGEFDMIFVDGDHKQIRRDLPWYNRIRPGGLMLFHDYSPNGSAMACPPVYRALEEMRQTFREFDVLVVDTEQIGMAGYIRREGETWPMQP